MSETCIVCLGDLGENASALPVSGEQLVHDVDAKLSDEPVDAVTHDAPPDQPDLPNRRAMSPPSESELIAHLLPCGHDLHNECLKPWVERANSCPICRQKFNRVELMKNVRGVVTSSYPVKDRIQVPDIDPSVLIEDEDEPEFQPCQICGNDENENVLLLCDDCCAPYHTYCVGLTYVPVESWYCEECSIRRAEAASMAPESAPPPRVNEQHRTRADARRRRDDNLSRASHWARIWETVHSRIHIDLDFPYGDEGDSPPRVSRSNRRDSQAWQRRLRLAEEQGGGHHLRHLAPVLDVGEAPASRPRPQPEEPESMEEIMAWNAMEKARDIDADPSGLSRKRRRTRSLTASPASPIPPPDPVPRKRPRTRRPNDVHEANSDGGEGSGSGSRRPPALNHPIQMNGNAGPTFLQSLLKEVESAPAEDETRGRPRLSLRAMSDHASPQGSSPDVSPTNSNAPSPRAGSTSPPPRGRLSSPHLTSRIEPVYPMLGPEDILSKSPRQRSPDRPKLKPKSRVDVANRTRSWVETTASSPTKSVDLSPTRANMSLSAKEKIQKLVKEALKEPYQASKIDKDQYTDINRNVSRLLYDKVGEDGDVEGDMSSEWQLMANLEVEKAIVSLHTGDGSELL